MRGILGSIPTTNEQIEFKVWGIFFLVDMKAHFLK
jgi:hypothetical protein